MKKENITGKNGYDIPCLRNLTGNEKMIVIISHGFGSSKESPTARALAEMLPEYGIGTCGYDFPGHGESPVDGEKLRIDACLNDLSAVEDHVLRLAPTAEIAYFSSSFGAYINLIYLAARPHAGRKSFLRSAAVDMPGLFKKDTTPEQYAELEAQGFLIMDRDYVRPLKIMKEFYGDLERYDVFALFKKGMAEIEMIHGDADETASPEDARRFAEQFDAGLTMVKGGDHRLMFNGGKEQVMKAARAFFLKNSGGDHERYLSALAYATRMHNGQKRAGGAEYISHPIAVAAMMRRQYLPVEYQIAGLFHDLLEDTDATIDDIAKLGGNEVAEAVRLLTKEPGYQMNEYMERIKRNPIARAVKAADRYHNLCSASVRDEAFKKRYISESNEWYLDLSTPDINIREAVGELEHSLETAGNNEK